MPEGGGDYEWCYCTPGGDRRLEETDLAALKSGGARRLEEADLAALKYFENVGNATHPSFVLAADEVSPFRNITFAATGGSTAPAAADVDGDGDLDLVVGSSHTKLHYFVNRGTAEAPVFFRESEPASEDPFSSISPGEDAAPALADIDGDGDVDLVFGNELGTVGYFTNTGSSTRPTFELGHQFTFRLSMTIALADTDGDGDVDLVAGEAGGALMYFESVRDVRFFSTVPASADPVASVVFSPPLQPDAAPCFVDVDGDGDLDVLVIQEKGRLTYLENTGSATRPVLEVAGGHHPFSRLGVEAAWGLVRPAFADLDGDDDLDLVLGLADAGGWRYYKNEGNATHPNFADPEGSTPFADLEYPATFSLGDVPGAVSGATSPAFGDLDGDLDLDLVVGRDLTKDGAGGATGALFYSINAGDRASPKFGGLSASGVNVSFAAGEATGVTFGSGSLLVPALGDLDGDGDPDLLVGDDRGALSFLVRGYCSPEGPCSNNGLCAGAAETFNEVSCECLVGFSGDQCDQCQGGYFGPACDVCPEGGDEERSRPRITDTCGVKNSGRSRGTCDDAVTGSGACACFPPFYGPGCEQGECPAGSLEVAKSVGIFYFSACDDCAPGTYSSAGDAQCAACDAGKYSGSGASACADCAPGTYSGAGTAACLPCAARSYAKAAGATSCVFAEPGSFVNETGASEQTACPAGTYSGSGAAACSDCEPGTYQDATGRPSCKRADGGSFVDADGASEQKPCAAGTYSSSGAETCSDCEPGRYTDGVGESSCALADAGFFVRETGASEQTACPAGYFSGSGASECLPCQPGTFADEGGAASCQLSNAGSFVASAGATAEVACAPGRYSGAGASYCALCPVGATNDGGEATCTTVDAGSMAPLPVEFRLTIQSSVLLDGVDADAFNADAPANKQLTTALNASLVVDLFTTVIIDSAAIVSVGPAAATAHGSTAIAFDVAVHYSASASESIESMKELILEDFDVDLLDKVKDGTLQNAIDAAVSAEGANICELASAGHFVADAGATAEEACAPGKISPGGGSSACYNCEPGERSGVGQSKCEQCQPGTYASDAGSTTCDLCEAGTFAEESGKSAGDECPAGKYAAAAGSTMCSIANAGSYTSKKGSSEQATCKAGTISGPEQSECTKCPAGSFAAEDGLSSCTLANAGYVVAADGASRQEPCDAGTISGAGQSSCDKCEPGTFASKQGSTTCSLANAGSYVAEEGATNQQDCAPGTFSSGAGQSSCDPSPPGSYVPRSGEVAAVIADAGYVVEEEGASEQTECRAGSYSGAKASACEPCEPGRYANLEAAATCEAAPPGTFAWIRGAVEPSTCPAGRFSGSGAVSCALCPDGQTSEAGSATCRPVDAGSTNAELSTVTFEIESGLVLDGLDVDRFSGDDAARRAFAAAIYEIVSAGGIVYDVSAEDVHLSAGRRRLDATADESTEVRFVARTVYTLVPGEDVVDDAFKRYIESLYIQGVQSPLLASIASGDAQRALDNRTAGTSIASAVIDAASSAALVAGETGVAVSEARATTDALVVACPPGTYSTSGAASCTPCQPGSYTELAGQTDCKFAEPGFFVAAAGASAQAPCPAGTDSTSAAVACSPCRAGYYSDRTGQPECERCETPTTTLDEGKTSCDACIDDYYRDGALDEALAATGSAALECTECCVKCDDLCTASDDDCAKCPAGTTIATVDARKNFWRTSAAATHLYRCDRQGACEGGANSTCARGHKGVRCGTCEAGYYYDSARNRCQHCGDKFDLSGDNIVGTCLVVAFALLFYAALHQRYGWKTIKSYVVAFFKEFDALDVYSDSRRRKHVDGNAAEREAVSDKRARSAPAGGDGAANDGEAPHRPRSSVMTKFKIVVATYQIATSIPWSLPQVRLPAALEQAMKLGSIVNLSLISFSKAECFGDVTYFHKLLFTTLFPAAVVALILAVALRRGPRMGGEERSRALAGALYWVCFALFIFVPGTSSYVFRYFSCAGYEGYGGETDLRVMRIDPTISCDSPGYDAWLPYVVLAVLAYPVGVPLGFACVLYRRRRHINPPIPRRKTRADAGGDAVAAVDRRLFPHLDNEEDLDFLDAAIERHRAALETLEKLDRRAEDPALGPVRFLYEEFRPECYGFIVFEVTRRIFLTGCLTMFLDGSISQIAVGLLGTMISYRVGNYYRPYVEEDDNIVFEIANTQLVLFFFYCVMVYATENLEEHDGVFSGKIFGICLILLLVSILVVAVWLVVVSHFGSAGVGRFFSLAKDRQRRRASLNSALAALNSLTSFSFRKPKPAGDEEPVDAGDVAVDDAAIPNLGRMAPPRLRERDPDPKPRGSA
ncbi:hypothetical protein JL721_1049 [Aureococcus anophagefferens]|nr:hypothetical protein JL721_1049 [Aureococcus anophagefferens]